MEYSYIILWLAMWFGIMGIPNYFFGIGRTNYYQQPIRNIVWYTAGISVLVYVFYSSLEKYFDPILNNFESQLFFIAISIIFLVIWIVVPLFLHNDYYNNSRERTSYQMTKIFEILFQQLCFLSGFILFDLPWYIFGVIFFVIHLPVPLIIPRRLGIITAAASLPGGLIFALLHSYGPIGFLVATTIHCTFYLMLPFIYSFRKIRPVKR